MKFPCKRCQNTECLSQYRLFKTAIALEFKSKKEPRAMEPNENSLAMMNELSTMSQAYVPNFIRSKDEYD